MPEEIYCQPKILIVDDNPGDIDVLLEVLKDFDVRAVLDGQSALDIIETEPPDLILLDIIMPKMDGFAVCKALQKNPKTAAIPIIFLSIRTDVDNIVRGLELGGVDYITKPFLPAETIARIHTHLKLCRALSDLKHLANTDPLTSISNRRSFFAQTELSFPKAKENHQPYHLFLIDLDDFKIINDSYGHAVGDKVMKGFVHHLQKEIPELTHFARLGGDEYVLILEGITEKSAREKLDKLRESINNHYLTSESSVLFTISIGMSTLEEQDPDIDALLLKADRNLYKSKQTKNTIH